MSRTDKTRIIKSVQPIGPASVRLSWSDGAQAEIDLQPMLSDSGIAELRDPEEFAKVQLGDWGHSLVWPSGAEMGADSLWLETLSATGHGDARAFLEWRLRHALSLSKAAEALGVSRRMAAYYSNGDKKFPGQSCSPAAVGKRAAGSSKRLDTPLAVARQNGSPPSTVELRRITAALAQLDFTRLRGHNISVERLSSAARDLFDICRRRVFVRGPTQAEGVAWLSP